MSITLPDVSEEEQHTLDELLERLAAKQTRNLLRASYYDGRRAILQVGTVIPPIYYRLGIVLGWSAKAVDILARRCNLDTFVWPDGDLSSLGFSEVWEDNSLGSEISAAMVSSLIHGTAFLINTAGDPKEHEPAGLIHVKDAMSATGEWNARSRRLENLLSVTRCDERGDIESLALYLDGETITAEREDGEWFTERTSHDWGVPAEPLVYKPRPGRPFGSSRISRPVMSLHDQALRTIIRMEGHADVYSFPEMWMLGANENIFKNSDGTAKASWQVMLGRIKGIPDDEDATVPRADVKQFAASSPAPHLAQLNALAKLFARETSLPDSALAIADMANPTSAESYDASQNELIAEAEGATDDWAPPLRRALVRALAMANGETTVPDEWRSISAKFRSPRFLSRAAQADAGLKQLTAVPWLAETEVGLELLGLSDQQIKRAMSDYRRSGGSAALRAIVQATAAGDTKLQQRKLMQQQGAGALPEAAAKASAAEQASVGVMNNAGTNPPASPRP